MDRASVSQENVRQTRVAADRFSALAATERQRQTIVIA